MLGRLDWIYLGRVDYEDGLRLQHAVRDVLLAGREQDVLLLLEHPPTVTLGRRGTDDDLRLAPEELGRRGVNLVRTDRGGLATYHGPGQLVGYPIVSLPRLRLGTREYVRCLADALAGFAKRHAIEAVWREDRPGLWVGGEKLVSFGIHVTHGVTTHGFALNVQPELAAFEWIVPCGHADTRATSMATLKGERWKLDAVAEEVAREVAAALGLAPHRVSPEALGVDAPRVG